ncbi:bifunctional nuclease family protein [bacterium]|nr:bifunctional nuclease family protein [bacterium]
MKVGDIPVEVTGISGFPPFQGGYMVILTEMEGKKWLPIFIGAAEAHNISLLKQGVKYVRPLTYDLFYNLLKEADARIKSVTVTELRDNTFYAEILLAVGDTERSVDARPSDAIALAIKTKAAIFVAPEVMKEAGMQGKAGTTSVPNKYERIRNLNKQMAEAVEIEEYETAAKIRDEIRAIQEQLSTS